MKRNKSKMTKIAIVLLITVFIFSLFKIGTTKASTEVVEITNVEIASKSDTVDVDSVKFEDGKIKNNVTFHKVGDQLTYNVTITNKEEKNYVLKTISDNNENESLTYSYSGYEGAKLEANKAATFKVTITYAKEVTDITQREQSNSVVLTLTFEDEAGNEKEEDVVIEPEDKTPTDDTTAEDNTPTENKVDSSEAKTTPVENNSVNPKTGDNIAVYITTAVASFALLIILTRKQMVMNRKSSKRNNHGKHGKHGMKMLGLLLAIALVVPSFSNISKAATSSLNTTLETSIKFMDKVVVSYEVDGETVEQVIPYDGTIENLEAPSKSGYAFTGWKLEDGTTFDADMSITEDMKLVPNFEIVEYSITYNLSGATAENPEKYTIEDEIKLNNPSKEGYTFTGWTGTGLSALTKDVTIAKGSTGNRKYTANFQINTYNIVFDSNSGEGTMSNLVGEYNQNVTLTANAFTKTGYTFTGWNTKADGSGTSYTDGEKVSNLTSIANETVYLYAQWEKDDITAETVVPSVNYGQKVNYSVEVNGITLDNWKLFMTDSDGYAYVIYGDYLPNAAIPQAAIDEGHLSKDGTYRVWGATNRTDLINSMTNSSNWSSFVSSRLQTAAANAGGTATVTGGATVTQFKKSWNDQYLLGQVTVTGNETSGWSIQSLGGTTGYNVAESNNMYFPHKSAVSDGSNSITGYWLASPYAGYAHGVMLVCYDGGLDYYSYSNDLRAFRPLVRLPSSILQLNDDGVSWDIAE